MIWWFLAFCAVVVGTFFMVAVVNTWLAKHDLKRMMKETEFRVWLDRVEARLHQYGANRLDRTLSDWLIDFESGLSPDLAAKNHLGAGKRAAR